MSTLAEFFKRTVATHVGVVMISLLPVSSAAQNVDVVADLLAQLKQADGAQAERLERQVIAEWSKSGSASMDLLLTRGRDALEVQDVDAAFEHFTALTDHAPDFAEGWHSLALVYFQQERFGPCLDALERTLALNPQHFGALRGVGAVYERVNRPDLAYRAYELVLSIYPNDPDVSEAVKRLEPIARGVTL
jgi:tetratricopeptide (TPR) repeat protein